MTVVPLALQLTAWIPAWWRGDVGGDDVLELVGATALSDLALLRESTKGLMAYCPELGVGVLPGPRAVTEAAVAAGQAVVLHAAPGEPAHLLLPGEDGWEVVTAGPSRPLDLDLRQADVELAEAVVAAEHELRETATTFDVRGERPAIRPLPPGAPQESTKVLVRAVRLWTAVAAVPPPRRPASLQHVLQCAARATLAAYRCYDTSDTRVRRYA